MKKTLRFLILALLVPLMLQSAKPASAQWFVGIHVGFGPPALPVYEQPICPGPDYIWTPGYWAWDADDGYYWVPGTWIVAPEVGFLWTPGWWGWGPGGYFWHEGYWGPHVGFYGGINYGFGYFGDGFWGGRWQGEHFFYNTAVWHVGEGFHNVYRDETIIHNTTIINNHVSYNGGEGGIDRHPTPQEESYTNERHIAPVAEQTRQVEAAHSNPQMRASMNHGKPEIAATARPGEFSGSGVEKASQAGGEYHAPPAGHEEQGGEGAHAAIPNPAHASDLPQHQPQHVESTGNPNLDKKYQQQQQQLADRQNQEHQQLQQRQEQEHQQAQQQHYSPQKTQQMEQKHQQQTQKLEQQHQQQTQRLTQRQTSNKK